MPELDAEKAAAVNRDFQIYSTLREYEERFNGVQVEMKKLASGWMLVVFGAVAFIVRGDLEAASSLIDSGPLLTIIGFAGNVGLLSLWILDQRVHQQLLNAAFGVGLQLERDNPELPPIRSSMWVNSGGRGMARYHALFYASPMSVNFAVAIYGAITSPSYRWWLLAIATLTLAALSIVLREWWRADLEARLRVDTEAIAATVERWKRDHVRH